MKTRFATHSMAWRCPAETQNPKPTQKTSLQDEHRAGLASYGRGYLQHNARNCLNMALGGGSSGCKWLWCLGLPSSSPAGEGGYMGGVAMRNLMPR